MLNSSHRLRRAAAVGAGAVLSLSVLAAPANAAPAFEPNPCSGRSDGGSGGTLGSNDPFTIYGTWYNCSGGTGVDKVQIDVANADDGPCISVPYGTSGSSTFKRYSYVTYPLGPGAKFRAWKRC